MNNQPYQDPYAAGQPGRIYYNSQGQAMQAQPNYQNYQQHGMPMFQQPGYIPQAQPAHNSYQPGQIYNFQQPPTQQANNAYPYNPALSSPDMSYRMPPSPQQVDPRRVPQYNGAPVPHSQPAMQGQVHQHQMHPRLPPMQSPMPQQHLQYQQQQQQQIFHKQQRISPGQSQSQAPPPQSSPKAVAPASQPQQLRHPTQVQQQPRQLQQSQQRLQPAHTIDRKPGVTHSQKGQQRPTSSPKPSPVAATKPLVPTPKAPTVLGKTKASPNVKKEDMGSTQRTKTSPTTHANATSQAPSPPSEDLMIALAEEYFDAAVTLKRDSDKAHPTEDYFQLLAAGLQSLKVVLVNMRPRPAVEAALRLRYASILFEEADENMDVEETLSNGITLCDRHRLLDLKYAMMHLLTRCMSKTEPKACLKYLDTTIRDAETHRQTAWIYAFRLFRATLSMQTNYGSEYHNAVTQLKIVAEKASDKGDKLVASLAAVMEAHVHISHANTQDSIEQAQRALASVRSLQHTSEAKDVPQLVIMAGFVDVSCSLYQADTAQATSKAKILQQDMDDLLESPKWTPNGYFQVPLSSSSSPANEANSSNYAGIVHHDERGRLSLSLNWLDREQLYGMGYMLAAVTRHHKNGSDENATAENLLKEAQAMFDASDTREPSEQKFEARRCLHALLLVNKIFEQCSRNRWAAAKSLLQQFNDMVKDVPSRWMALSQYLEGVTLQATGSLDSALKAYQHESLALSQTNDYRAPYQRELVVLATMNSLLIIRSPDHPLHSTYASTLSALEPLAQASPSKNIYSAHHFVRAAMPDLQATSSILDTKSYLQTALNAAKQTSNNQLMCITLNILSYKFFRGVVGEQAEKSGRATQTLARKGKDSLWLSVADGALAETLEAQGKVAEANSVWKEAIDLAGRLPKTMRGVAEEKIEEGEEANGVGHVGLTDQFAF